MNIKLLIALSAILLLFIGCGEYGVQLRIQNNSQFDFQDVSVNNVSFGPLNQDAQSKYLPFESIYEREFVQVVINDKVLKLIPEDFDESEYKSTGDYTYMIDIINEKYISLNFKSE